jgi:hypothetical protein
MLWLQRRGCDHGGGSLHVLSEAAANSRSEPMTETVRRVGEGVRLHVGGAWGKARATQAKIRGGLDQVLLGRGGGVLGWATPLVHRCCWGSARGRDELWRQLLLKRSPGMGQHTTSPRRFHGNGDGGYARGREERNGTEERNEEEKGEK